MDTPGLHKVRPSVGFLRGVDRDKINLETTAVDYKMLWELQQTKK